MTFKDSRISHDISWYLIIFGHWEVCALHCSTTSKQQAVIPNQKLSTNLIQVLSQREAASIAALDHANARLKQDGLDGHATWWGVRGSLVGLGAHLKPKTISVATCSRVCHSWSITWSDPICMTWLACSTVAHLMAQGVAKNPNLLPQDHNFHVRYDILIYVVARDKNTIYINLLMTVLFVSPRMSRLVVGGFAIYFCQESCHIPKNKK